MSQTVADLESFVKAQFPYIIEELDQQSSLEEATKQAMRHINRDMPRIYIVSFAGEDVQEYEIDSEIFDKEISSISRLEYPVGENPRKYLIEGDDWFLDESPDGEVSIVFVDHTPATGETFRIRLAAKHTFDDSASTLGSQAFSALCAKVCELIAKDLEARHIYSSSPTMDADTVSFYDKARNLRLLSAYWAEEYRKFAGLNKEVKAAQASAEADIKTAFGLTYIWHPKRHR